MPNHFTLTFFLLRRRDVSCSHSNRDLFSCEDNIEDITWPRVDTNFIFECSTREIEKISSVYLYSERYNNKAYKILLKRCVIVL